MSLFLSNDSNSLLRASKRVLKIFLINRARIPRAGAGEVGADPTEWIRSRENPVRWFMLLVLHSQESCQGALVPYRFLMKIRKDRGLS
jgi:hypothetical protein